jgi:hypothetical protein
MIMHAGLRASPRPRGGVARAARRRARPDGQPVAATAGAARRPVHRAGVRLSDVFDDLQPGRLRRREAPHAAPSGFVSDEGGRPCRPSL